MEPWLGDFGKYDLYVWSQIFKISVQSIFPNDPGHKGTLRPSKSLILTIHNLVLMAH